MQDKQTRLVQRRYDRVSRFFDFIQAGVEKRLLAAWRKALLGGLKGRILEIGVGTGKNLEYYNKNAKVTAIDISPGMLERAKIKLSNLHNKNIALCQMDAQNLDFPNNHFDYVVCTFVLCSVPDPVKVAREMKRVCKKSGKILMFEHVLSKYKMIAMFEHLLNPITRKLCGANVNRDTLANLRAAGITPDKVTNLAFFDVVRRIEVQQG